MEKLVLIIHVLAALGVIGLVLLQHGKGADMGASFGGGASGSLFGVTGSSNFMSRATAVFVVIFFATSLTLAYMASHKTTETSVIKANSASVVVPVVKPTPSDVPSVEMKPEAAQDVPK